MQRPNCSGLWRVKRPDGYWPKGSREELHDCIEGMPAKVDLDKAEVLLPVSEHAFRLNDLPADYVWEFVRAVKQE